jgi:DNA-binding transcriptional LysR family regulator
MALRRLAEQAAPGISFHSVPNSKADVAELLLNAEVDVVLSHAAPLASPRLRERALSESHYVCAMRRDHPLASGSLSLDSFAAADHLRVSPTGEAAGPIDEILRARGRGRRVAMTVNHYAQVAPLLRETSLISTIPFEAVAESVERHELRAVLPPISIPPIKLSLLWHERTDGDAGQRWLRSELASVIAELNRCHPVPAGITAPARRPRVKGVPETTIETSVPFA